VTHIPQHVNTLYSLNILRPNDIKLLKYLAENGVGLGVNLPVLLQAYAELEGLDPKEVRNNSKLYYKYYMRLRRFITRLKRNNLVDISKVDGLIWIKPRVDLITFNAVKFKQSLNNVCGFKHPARFNACGVLMDRRCLEVEDWVYLDELLRDYVDDVRDRVVVLGRYVGSELVVRFLRYRHRFLNSELRRRLRVFDLVFERASMIYNVGVFLTLTMNPNCYSNLYDACKRISEALNRLMSFLSRRLGRRPLYVAVLEPQDSGNPHLHVVMFGVGRVEDHFKLTRILVRHGFGYVHFEYKVMLSRGRWVWANSRPGNCNVIDVRIYLRKYLEKEFNVNDGRAFSKLGFYFASNKRFYTCSRSLLDRRGKKRGGWFFIGSWHFLKVPDCILEYAGVILVYSEVKGWDVVVLDTGPPCLDSSILPGFLNYGGM